MDQFIRASLSHTHYWYEGDMLKVPAKQILRVDPTGYKYLSYGEALERTESKRIETINGRVNLGSPRPKFSK